MSERLHDLLREAVPDDAPSLDPRAVVAAARRARRRGRALTGAVVALVLVAGGALATTVGRDRSDHVADDSAPDPYGAPTCPVTLPPPGTATPTLDLGDVASVRLCPDLSMIDDQGTARAVLSGMDALVTGIDDLGDRLARLDRYVVRCGPDSPVDERQALQVEHADGRTEVVPMRSCLPVRVAGREVDPGAIVDRYLLALRAQREARPSSPPRRRQPVCETSLKVPTPAQPGRGHLVAAVKCGPNGAGTALDDDQVAALDEAWQRPGALDDGDGCTTSPLYLGAVTDQGDLVVLEQSSCGELVWRGDLDESATLPTSLQRLGVRA
ncbi:hypothetical protein [Nocardioides sp. LML1-1-1.1]|uniref:hypothetical protein n=1 Tax=Nocardioides sp. LML1-1-1.1 TaxID=3135248 RepID=UPI00343DEDAD